MVRFCRCLSSLRFCTSCLVRRELLFSTGPWHSIITRNPITSKHTVYFTWFPIMIGKSKYGALCSIIPRLCLTRMEHDPTKIVCIQRWKQFRLSVDTIFVCFRYEHFHQLLLHTNNSALWLNFFSIDHWRHVFFIHRTSYIDWMHREHKNDIVTIDSEKCVLCVCVPCLLIVVVRSIE